MEKQDKKIEEIVDDKKLKWKDKMEKQAKKIEEIAVDKSTDENTRLCSEREKEIINYYPEYKMLEKYIW